jgi:hypothetical protein
MNTGIGDVYNLAWKLAFVIKGLVGEKLLDTYNEERLANAKRLLESTDRMFELAAGDNWLMGLIRTTIFPPVANFVTSLDSVKKRIFPLISQIGITYRNFSLSKHTDDEPDEVKAGDRLPYFLFDGQSIFHKLNEPKFHLLLFSTGETKATICEEFAQEFGEMSNCLIVPLDSRVQEIFEKEKEFIVLLRPDNHLALISSEISLALVREYLKGIER